MALTKAKTKAIWLQMLLYEVGFFQYEPTTIYLDNQSTIIFSENPKYHFKRKHVDT